MTSNVSYDLLSSLLPTSSFALAYALPLLLVSLLLSFAGAFLTLDRTRVFPSSAPATKVKTKTAWLSSLSWSLFLHGGVGGLCSGFAFGVHFTTFLSLLIPSTTSSSALSPKAFLAIWILSVIFCTALAGRWKYASIVLASMSGFATLGLSLSVITHPTLIVRIVLVAVFTVLGTVLCLLPFPRVGQIALRLASCTLGSFGTVLCIAILARNPAWANVWERLWMHDGTTWGTSQEKGLSAGYCLLICLGLACDTFLHTKFGENPDERWDRYLAKYSDNLPNDDSRAGTFAPFVSLYDRLMGRDRYFAPIVADQKVPIATPDVVLPEKSHGFFDLEDTVSPLDGGKSQPGFLRKKGSPKVKGVRNARRPVKFRPTDEESLSSSDDDDDLPPKKPLVPRSLSAASSTTLTNGDSTLRPPNRKISDIPDYSDYEEDLGVVGRGKVSRDDPAWTPEFIRKHSTRPSASRADSSTKGESRTTSGSPAPSRPTLVRAGESPVLTMPDMPSLPATPSLIRAVDRISAAYAAQTTPPRTPDGLPLPRTSSGSGKPWDSFWADVKAKAHS